MQRRSRAALIALSRSGRAPPDLIEEVARAMFDRPTERFKTALRQIHARQMSYVACRVFFRPPSWVPILQQTYAVSAEQLKVIEDGAHALWLGVIERCDDDLCRALAKVAAHRDLVEYRLVNDKIYPNYPEELVGWYNRFLRLATPILSTDVVDYLEARLATLA